MGGGPELALASAKLGLPEGKLGVLPGAGGTQRMPHWPAPEIALDLITSGRPIAAEYAHELGDIDATWVNGYGFPACRGGPMYYAERIGLGLVYETVLGLHQRNGSRWAPSRLLERLAKNGGRWADVNEKPPDGGKGIDTS